MNVLNQIFAKHVYNSVFNIIYFFEKIKKSPTEQIQVGTNKELLLNNLKKNYLKFLRHELVNLFISHLVEKRTNFVSRF